MKLTKLKAPIFLWAIVAALFFINLFLFFKPEFIQQKTSSEPIKNPRLFFKWLGEAQKKSIFDGRILEQGYEEFPIMVMMDNYFAARPFHSGINEAAIVYEALAEGGITRLMLIFPSSELDRVGPIRSARDYFVDFAEEYGGIFVHAGGSPSALSRLQTSPRLFGLDEDPNQNEDAYTFRDLRLASPHNLFVNLKAVRDLSAEKKWQKKEPFQNFCFRDKAADGEPVSSFSIGFSPDPLARSKVFFEYDPSFNGYTRYYENGKKILHADQADGSSVSPKNIIVQIAKSALIEDDEKERISIENIGSGKAFLYRDGVKIEGTWIKKAKDQATEFKNLDGNPFCLSPGQTWIAILDSELY